MRAPHLLPALLVAVTVLGGCLAQPTAPKPTTKTASAAPAVTKPAPAAKVDLSKAPTARAATGVTVRGTVTAPASAVSASSAKKRALLDDADAPVAGADVFLADAAGDPIPDLPTVQTDANGLYVIPNVPANFTYVVAVKAHTHDGRDCQLQTLVKVSSLGSSADISLASTMVSASVLDGLKGSLGELNPVAFKAACHAVGPHVFDGGAPDFSDHYALVHRMRDLRDQLSDVQDALADLQADLADIKTTLGDIQTKVDELHDQQLQPSAQPSWDDYASAPPEWDPPQPWPSGEATSEPAPWSGWLPDGWGTGNPMCPVYEDPSGGLIANNAGSLIANDDGGMRFHHESPTPVTCAVPAAGALRPYAFQPPVYLTPDNYPLTVEFYETASGKLAGTLTFNQPDQAASTLLQANVHYDLLLTTAGDDLDNSATDVFLTDGADGTLQLPF